MDAQQVNRPNQPQRQAEPFFAPEVSEMARRTDRAFSEVRDALERFTLQDRIQHPFLPGEIFYARPNGEFYAEIELERYGSVRITKDMISTLADPDGHPSKYFICTAPASIGKDPQFYSMGLFSSEHDDAGGSEWGLILWNSRSDSGFCESQVEAFAIADLVLDKLEKGAEQAKSFPLGR